MKRNILFIITILTLSIAVDIGMARAEDTSARFDTRFDTSASPSPAIQSGGTNGTPGAGSVIPTLKNPLKADNVQKLLLSFVDIIIFLGVIMAVFIFIFIGFKFVWAQGDEKALTEAKQWFLWAVVGTAILIGSKVIVSVIENTFTSSGLVNEQLLKGKK